MADEQRNRIGGDPAQRELLIVWWTMTGGTQQLVRAALEGAARECAAGALSDRPAGAQPVAVRAVRADRAQPGDVLGASGYLFATPENLGSMAGMLKDFFDRTYYAALDRVNGRPYATMICAGSDGHGAARQIERIATGWRLRQVAPPLIVCTHAQTPQAILAPKSIEAGELRRAAELGEAMAAGVGMGLW